MMFDKPTKGTKMIFIAMSECSLLVNHLHGFRSFCYLHVKRSDFTDIFSLTRTAVERIFFSLKGIIADK